MTSTVRNLFWWTPCAKCSFSKLALKYPMKACDLGQLRLLARSENNKNSKQKAEIISEHPTPVFRMHH